MILTKINLPLNRCLISMFQSMAAKESGILARRFRNWTMCAVRSCSSGALSRMIQRRSKDSRHCHFWTMPRFLSTSRHPCRFRITGWFAPYSTVAISGRGLRRCWRKHARVTGKRFTSIFPVGVARVATPIPQQITSIQGYWNISERIHRDILASFPWISKIRTAISSLRTQMRPISMAIGS